MLIISHKSRFEFVKFLEENDFPYIKTIDNPNLDKRIADHPDLSIFIVNKDTIFIDNSVKYEYRKRLLNKNIIPGESVCKSYPKDAIYNLYMSDSYYIHNDFTEKNISLYMKDHNIKHLYVKQGYSRCSIIPMGEKILTSDFGIYKSLKDKIEVILLEKEKIELDGFDQGFIGGCCGFFDNTLIFNGNIEKLKSFETIKNEADKSKIKLLYPKSCDLLDTGSILYC